jgi:uncharacterized protein YbcV (DUF1398 family)
MNGNVINVVEDCTRASNESRTTFPEVVSRLSESGVERYHADLVRAENTFFMPDGTFHSVASASPYQPAERFSAPGVEQAIRAIQARQIDYREFCRRISAAGCVGYFVSLTGRSAHYYGRGNEFHVEQFPSR